MNDCPHFRDVQRFLASPTDEPELDWLERHLNDYEFCCDRLSAINALGTIVPGEHARWQTRSPSSAALKQAIDRLQKESPTGQAAALRIGSEFYLDFLQPTEEPGFIGRIGNYQVRRIIGRGGMGIVLEALDPLLKRAVAIKMLAPWTVLDAETKARFLREAQSAAALTHENVVAIYGVEQVEGKLFLVLEYVAGESLDDRLRREGKLPLGEVVRIGAQVARGLAAAHSRGLIHRDIKPGNILLVEETGRAKIADFGLAKTAGEVGLTQDGTVVGTPEFMSPEQATNQQPDERSDLFSLGAVLYYASTGCSPFRADTLLLTLDNVRHCQPPHLQNLAPELPPWFCELVNRLLAPAPEDRLGWATAVAEMLERPSSQATIVNLPLGPATVKIHDSAKPKTENLRQWWPIAAVLLVIAVVIPAWIVGSGRMRTETSQPPTALPPESKPPAPQEQPLPPGFVIAGREGVLGSLAAALEAANDGDTIEVRGNGPFLTPPLTIAGKRLTIRAAVGSLPVILSETPSSMGTKPMLASDADLRLEGLEIHWSIEPRVGLTEAEMLARSIVVGTQGRLVVTHCRIGCERLNGCVGGTCRDLIVHRSHLLAKNGMGVFWRVEAAGRLDIEGCILENHFGIDLLAGTRGTGDAPKQIHISHSTLAALQGVQFIIQSPIRQPIPIFFDHNLVDANFLFVLMPRLAPRAKSALKLDDPPVALRTLVAWSEESNVYRRGLHYLNRPLGQLAFPQPADIANVEAWLELWRMPSAKSIEAEIRFQARPASSQTAPLALDQIGEPSGSVPTAVGAPPDQVGPGPAYDAWRKSAEYAHWPTF